MDAAQKSFQLQSQLRQNAENLKSTMKDLYSWEKEIKLKEQELKRSPPAATVTKQNYNDEAPPVRSQLQQVGDTKRLDKTSASKPFVKEKVPKVETPTEKVEMPIDPNEEKRKQANAIKELGNEYVKRAEFVKGIEKYTAAIDVFPEDVCFYTNRALCYLKLKKYYDCIEDCERAIKIDSRSVKAYYRRMLANEELGNDRSALNDCNTILMIEPRNKDARASLERINETLRSNVTDWSINGPNFCPVRSDMCFIEAIDKPPHQRSKKLLKRVAITDVVGPKESKNQANSNIQVTDEVIDKLFNSYCGAFEEVKPKIDKTGTETAKTTTEKTNITSETAKTKIETATTTIETAKTTTETAATTTKTAKITTDKTNTIVENTKATNEKADTTTEKANTTRDETKPTEDTNRSKSATGDNKSSESAAKVAQSVTIEDEVEIDEVVNDYNLKANKIKETKAKEQINKKNEMSKSDEPIEKLDPNKVVVVPTQYYEHSTEEPIPVPTSLDKPLPPPPTATAQFYANWKELSPIQKYHYLKSIDIGKLGRILGAGFDSDTLTDVINTLRNFYVPNKDPNLAATLLAISKNNQVSILSLLLSTEERKALQEILNKLKEDKAEAAIVALVAKTFNLK